MYVRRFALWILAPLIALALIAIVVTRLLSTPAMTIDTARHTARIDSLIPFGLQLVRFYKIPDTSLIYAKFTAHPEKEHDRIAMITSTGLETHVVVDLDTQQIALHVSFTPRENTFLGIESRETYITRGDPIIRYGDQLFFRFMKTEARQVTGTLKAFPFMHYLNMNAFEQRYMTLDGKQTTSIPEMIRESTSRSDSIPFGDWLIEELSSPEPGPFPHDIFLWDTPVPEAVWLNRDRVQGVYDIIEQTKDGPVRHSIRFADPVKPFSVNRPPSQYDFTGFYENWSFGASRFYTSNRRSRVYEFMPEHLGSGGLEQLFTPRTLAIPGSFFATMNNDLCLIASPINNLRTIMLIETDVYVVYERNPGESFSTPTASHVVPRNTRVSAFPLDDEHLLMYRNGEFWSMHYKTLETKILYPIDNTE